MTNANQTIQGIILSGTDRDLPVELPHGMDRYTNFVDMAQGSNAKLRSAWDTIMGRTIAMKTLLASVALDGRQRRRFLREARVTAQLQHPNTVPVYEIGNDPVEGIYFTMKRISGENLLEVIKRLSIKDPDTEFAFPLRRLIDIAINVAQALAYSHVRGVIHRDIKPENIWVGNFGEVIVLDWGVAKVWGYPDEIEKTEEGNAAVETPNGGDASLQTSAIEKMSNHSIPVSSSEMNLPQEPLLPVQKEDDPSVDQLRTLTNNGQRLGTPLYMSPEQVRGNHYVDDRSDIFSLGVVLYEILTQKEPFRGRNIDETFEFITTWNPPKPSMQALFRNIPPELDNIVSKAIAKKADDRYQSMLDLIADLEAVIDLLPAKK